MVKIPMYIIIRKKYNFTREITHISALFYRDLQPLSIEFPTVIAKNLNTLLSQKSYGGKIFCPKMNFTKPIRTYPQTG